MYRSPREAHEARIYTGAYRVYGTIHLVPGAGTADLLNQERPYLPVTGALVYAPGFRHPPEARELKASVNFLALRKERVQWVAGGEARRAPNEPGPPGEEAPRLPLRGLPPGGGAPPAAGGAAFRLPLPGQALPDPKGGGALPPRPGQAPRGPRPPWSGSPSSP